MSCQLRHSSAMFLAWQAKPGWVHQQFILIVSMLIATHRSASPHLLQGARGPPSEPHPTPYCALLPDTCMIHATVQSYQQYLFKSMYYSRTYRVAAKALA